MVMLGPWIKGMNNRSSDHDLPRGVEGNLIAVRNAVSVDFDNGGKARRRKGCTKVYSGMLPKGGYSCPDGRYFIEQGSIKRFNADNTATILFQGITGTEYAWGHKNGTVYFSDGDVSLKIKNDSVSKWGMDVPSTPLVYGVAGTYGGGQYLAAICWVDTDGVESGASQVVPITLPDDAGIVFGNLPAATDPQVSALRLYLSMPNGSELYHVADVTPGTTDYTITAGRYDDSNIFEHAHISPAPAGRIIRFHNGRAFVADSLGHVFYSDPLEFDHWSGDYIYFPQINDVMEPVAGGIFFCYGDKTEFHSGDVEDGFTVIPLVNYGGIYGTGKSIPNSANVCWQSQRGMCVGAPDGSMKNIVEEHVAPDTGTSGATLIREQNGIRQFIASIQNPTISKLAATSFMEAEIIRRGALT